MRFLVFDHTCLTAVWRLYVCVHYCLFWSYLKFKLEAVRCSIFVLFLKAELFCFCFFFFHNFSCGFVWSGQDLLIMSVGLTKFSSLMREIVLIRGVFSKLSLGKLGISSATRKWQEDKRQ